MNVIVNVVVDVVVNVVANIVVNVVVNIVVNICRCVLTNTTVSLVSTLYCLGWRGPLL